MFFRDIAFIFFQSGLKKAHISEALTSGRHPKNATQSTTIRVTPREWSSFMVDTSKISFARAKGLGQEED